MAVTTEDPGTTTFAISRQTGVGLLIATKGGSERTGPSGRHVDGERRGWSHSARPEHLRAACEGSLRRLKVDRIDLYQLHSPDPLRPYGG
jgi:pyridoxine 4-dehydrogenase